MNLEIDRELIEDIRMIAYGPAAPWVAFGGWSLDELYQGGADNFPDLTGSNDGSGRGWHVCWWLLRV